MIDTMNLFGTQKFNNLDKISKHANPSSNQEIKKILEEFQLGYTKRNIDDIDHFVDKLFTQDTPIVVGTSFNEVFVGIKDIKELLYSDWKYWGDVTLDLANVYISNNQDTASFMLRGNVKHSFQFSKEKDAQYVDIIKNRMVDSSLSINDKIAHIDWMLSLAYHHRASIKRNACIPLLLSGALIKEDNSWKFKQMQFSIAKPNFPDIRLESSKDFVEQYQKDIRRIKELTYASTSNNLPQFMEDWLTSISKQQPNKNYYLPYSVVLGFDNQCYYGEKAINSYFRELQSMSISLETAQGIYQQHAEYTTATIIGILKCKLSKEQLLLLTEAEIFSILQSNKEDDATKLFTIHRSIAYLQKEANYGEDYSYPIRMSTLYNQDKKCFEFIHFSFPYYWTIEGIYNDHK